MFKHGGDIYNFAKTLGIKPSEVLDFSSNINPYKPCIKKDFNTIDISKYADPSFKELKKSLAKHFHAKAYELALYNGASSAIYEFIRLHPSKTVCIYSPAYAEYKKACLLAEKKLVHIKRFQNLYELPVKNSLVIFVNPATPDGSFYDLEKLFKLWKKQHCSVLIDESFLEFTPYSSALRFLKEYQNLVILKSLTKFYACAGVRLGILISHQQNLKTLQKHQALWQLSTYDTCYIQEALKDSKHQKKSLLKNQQNLALLEKTLKDSGLFSKVYESKANYILCKLKNIDATSLQKRLAKQHILIRDCANFDTLNKYYVRFAVKKPKAILALKRALHA